MNAGYLRTSVWKEHKISIEAQREHIASTITSNQEIQYFEDRGFSGATIRRPSFQRLIKWIESSMSERVLYVWRYDRISRNVTDALNFLELCQRHHVEVVSVLEPIPSSLGNRQASQMLFVQILFSLAEFTRSVTVENINQGLAQKKVEKKVLSAKVPFGYVYQRGKIVPSNSDAIIVKYIFELYGSTTMGYQKIAKQLQREGMTIFGKNFKKYHVFQILTNPLYMGEIGHKSKNLTAYISEDITPIVSRGLFEQVASKRLKHTLKKKDTYVYLLRKKIICPYCSRKLSPKKQRNTRYCQSYRYYECSNDTCNGYRIGAVTIENQVKMCVTAFITKKETINQLITTLQIQLEKLTNTKEVKVSQLNKEKNNIFNQFEQGQLSNEKMMEKLSSITQQIEKTTSIAITERQLEERIVHLLHLSDSGVQEALWSFIDEVYVTPDKHLKEVILYDIRIKSDIV